MVSHEHNEKTEGIGGRVEQEVVCRRRGMIEDENYKFEWLKCPMRNLMQSHVHDKVVHMTRPTCGVAWI